MKPRERKYLKSEHARIQRKRQILELHREKLDNMAKMAVLASRLALTALQVQVIKSHINHNYPSGGINNQDNEQV